MRRKPFWLVLILTVAVSPLLALPVGADTPEQSQPRFLTGPNAGDPVDIALAYFQAEAATYGLTASDVAELTVRSSYVSSHTGATHVNINQQFDGLEVFGADTTITIAADGSVAYVGGASISNLAVAGVTSADADLAAADALEAVADALELDEPQDVRTMRRRGGAARETVLTDGGISDEPIPARLGWQPTPGGLRLAWQLVIDDASDVHLWNATVDADTGDLLEVEDWTSDSTYDGLEAFLAARGDRTSSGALATRVSASGEPRTDVGPINPVDDGSSYRVLQTPMDSPLDGPRVVVTNPAEATASPFGWHDVSSSPEPDYTITRGNNVHAYFDQDANNQPDPDFDVDGGADLTFDFDADLDEHAQNYREADLVNLFYWCNVIHDVLYLYGFDEASGNFQVTNYTGEGVGGDDVRCEGADGGGTNNANFSTPAADGGRPRMQMYLWPGNQFGTQNQVIVDGVDTFGARWARFSPGASTPGESGAIVDGGTGCAASDYPDDLPSGFIGIVSTGGGCNNPNKGQVAQALGASALIIASGGSNPSILSGTITLPRVEIPVVSVTTSDGAAIRDELPASGIVRRNPDHPGIRTGDLDNGIIIHEYGHGVSNRLTGGPGINCIGNNSNNPHRLGEAWSDYYAITMLIDPELDDFDGQRGLVPYSLFQADRSGSGLRPRPYSRTWEIQPFSYASAASGGWLNGGSLSMPHGIGHGFNAVLMDMTWNLIDKHGFNPNLYEPWDTGGNNLALQLVTDGLKLQGCLPGMVDARNGILMADELLTNGENQCTIWAAFARRGLGFSADQGVLSDRNDHTEAFDTHPDCREGFTAPIHAVYGELNTVAAGSTVPLRFSLGSNQGLDILAPNSPFSRRVDCDTLAVPSDNPPFITPRAAPVNTSPAGRSGLSVNNQGVYRQNWQTEEAWVDTCRELVLTRADGVQHRAFFRFVEPD